MTNVEKRIPISFGIRTPSLAPPVVRLQKYLADAGVASRRASEQLIVAGQVSVNGHTVRELGAKVQPDHDRVAIEGKPVKARRKLYVALHKPRGYLCTRRDPAHRRTLGELLPDEWAHLYSVGRLDRDSEGLIFFTNDGDFALRLTHPRYGTRKTYLVTIEGRVERAMLDKLTAGVTSEGEQLKAEKARLISANNTQSVLELELAEGKYREIRRLCEALGLSISRLQRTRIGPIRLGELRPGKWRTLTEPEIRSLLPPL
jgi:23S rRNA pseudouridine2605 synthase